MGLKSNILESVFLLQERFHLVRLTLYGSSYWQYVNRWEDRNQTVNETLSI